MSFYAVNRSSFAWIVMPSPSLGWVYEELPNGGAFVSVRAYLRHRKGSRMHVRAKCRPTTRKQPPFYKLFVTIAWSVQLEGPQFMVEGGLGLGLGLLLCSR